jgi:prepilin-type N-terminal cleavage/methylation domain-containing protein
MVRRKRGFTLIEVVLAVSLTGLIGYGVWSMAASLSTYQQRGARTYDARTTMLTVERTLLRASHQTGRGLISAPNLSAIHIREATSGTIEHDTITILTRDGNTHEIASQPCPSGLGTCLMLVGNVRSEFAEDEILLIGIGKNSARTIQITGLPIVVNAPCGTDCPEPISCDVTSSGITQSITRITSAPCSQTYFSDGTTCFEERQEIILPPRQDPLCSKIVAGRQFTPIQYVDRTSTMGFPLGGTPITTISAGGSSPRAFSQRINATRYWIQNQGTDDPVLVRQTGLTNTGAWNNATRVVGPVASLRGEITHRHTTTWSRGTGSITEASLVRNVANPNYFENLAPTGAQPVPGYGFLQGYHTISGFKIRYGIPHPMPDGTTRFEQNEMIASTSYILEGGGID